MSIVIPDVSEFQTVDFSVFNGPIIVRAHNGRREDYHWQQHAAGASAQPWWAAYQYLPSNVGAGWAAQQFLATLGTFRPNCTILDLEEGTGNQVDRQHEWLTVMANDPARDWTYSGDYFARTHGLTVDWVAAYQSRAPSTAHLLWQFTDAHNFDGIGTCDGSVFDGTLADLIALTNPVAPSQQPEEPDMCNVIHNNNEYLLHAGKLVYVTAALPATIPSWTVDDGTWGNLTKAFGGPVQ